MAIEKYVTKAIVIEAYDSGEHDRSYKLFTREYGLIIAHAKSVRKLESKLRAHILPRTISLVTLVKGREVWRLVGAEEQKSPNRYIHDVTQLVQRLMKGEGEHTVLYDRLISFLDKVGSFEELKARILLYYIVLVDLGYADIKIIGAKNLKEYNSWGIDDLYTHIVLSDKVVRAHIHAVLQDIHL